MKNHYLKNTILTIKTIDKNKHQIIIKKYYTKWNRKTENNITGHINTSTESKP